MAFMGVKVSFFGTDPSNLSISTTLILVITPTLAFIYSYVYFLSKHINTPDRISSYFLFFYSSFLKPHRGDSRANQQDALESFYRSQAGAYDTTRRLLLMGREDMLGLSAAQLKSRLKKMDSTEKAPSKPIWVDIGGGTGWNVEAMNEFLPVPNFFSHVYVVDLSPSLCEVARKRFERLGWDNVTVVCQDAHNFYLPSWGDRIPPDKHSQVREAASLVTMSYSLSMIPDFFSLIDSLGSMLRSDGVLGVVDFYVQSKAEFASRNYTGGSLNRHVNPLSRAFWRAWFDFDRVGLESSRRDYLEYRFGTLLSTNHRNRLLGLIPYYIWIGCPIDSFCQTGLFSEEARKVHTGADHLMLKSTSSGYENRVEKTDLTDLRDYAGFGQQALGASSLQLPHPSVFYQGTRWRIHYQDQLPKYTRFKDDYIYAFTWEDARVDERLLRLKDSDRVIAISSAGDNVLSYLAQGAACIHAVDVNPAQNHLLELKAACYACLPYQDFWRIFGQGKHTDFRSLLIERLSPHLSARAFQFWLARAHIIQSSHGGLYNSGGSRHALMIFRWITRLFGVRTAVESFLHAKTLNEQREVWQNKLRPVLLSKIVCSLVVAQERFLWTALGVPRNQLAMIENDYAQTTHASQGKSPSTRGRSRAILQYMVDTLDPVAEQSHVAVDNPYYYVCLAGEFSKTCPPEYLQPATHAKLSRAHALDNLRIHTEEFEEVIGRMSPGSLTVAVIMDSMDWFDGGSPAAVTQIDKLNRVLAMGGRVLLRSAALEPWYVKTFEGRGFVGKRHGARSGDAMIDRVNMYASCWICTKKDNLPPPTPETDRMDGEQVPNLHL